MPAIDYVIAGLGNPGPRYTQTRHNVGFMLIDHLVSQEKDCVSPLAAGKNQARIWQWAGADDKHILLVQPQTYMNLSGRALKAISTKYALQPSQFVVIHDELDLQFGRARMKYDGGLAGHNGLRSIAAELGSKDFYRVRIGIGRPEPGQEVIRYVLSSFPPWEREQLFQILSKVAEGVRLLCTQGMQAGMNYVHSELK